MPKKMLLLAMATILSGSSTFAQNGQGRGRFEPKSTIAVTVDGLTCNNGQGTIPALTWNFGVTVAASGSTGSGAGATKANLSDLNVTRRADGCTPVLFADVVTGRHISRVTIVQQDSQKDDIFTVTLQDVIISSYQLGGDQSSELPVEQVGFNFAKICVADSVTGTKACWDLRTARTF
ncbi:MAG: type VI secretion system tube protein Hcp [Terriglobales bacterium]